MFGDESKAILVEMNIELVTERRIQMTVDFSQPITSYELLAIILAVLALAIPLIKWIYENCCKRLAIDFLPSNVITLFFNRSGAYVTLGGVYETKNKPAVIKKVSVKVIRMSDHAELSLIWSTFPSPVYRRIAGNFETSFETAHAFKVEADTLTPAYIEFENERENVEDSISQILLPVRDASLPILNNGNNTIFESDRQLRLTQQFQSAKLNLNELFFWKRGAYNLVLRTQYNDVDFSKSYSFDITEEESNRLRKNIDYLLVDSIANHFHAPLAFFTIKKDFVEKAQHSNM